MKIIHFLVTFIFLYSISYSQEATKVALIHENSYDLIDAENQAGVLYGSLFDLSKALQIPISTNDNIESVKLSFENYKLHINSNNPFVSIYDLKDSLVKSFQLSSPTYTKNDKLYISLISMIDVINNYWNKELVPLAANRVKILEKIKKYDESESVKSVQISSIAIEPGYENILLKIKIYY